MLDEELMKIAGDFIEGLPGPVIKKLEDVDLIVYQSVENASKELASLCEDLQEVDVKESIPVDCKGIFIGTPLEVEESDDTEEEETIYLPDGFIVMIADNINSTDEIVLTMLHEIGHALGMDEEDVKKLGLGVSPTPSNVIPTQEGNGNNAEQSG